MTKEHEASIIHDLKDWKSLIKPYTSPETKLAWKQIFHTILPFVGVFIAAAIVYD